MGNLGKLASISKRLKQSKVSIKPGGGQTGTDVIKKSGGKSPSGGKPASKPHKDKSPASSSPEAKITPVAVPSGGGAVSVSLDLAPVRSVLGEIRDVLTELTAEVRKSRESGLGVNFTGDSAERFDSLVRNVKSGTGALKSLSDKIVANTPESLWYEEIKQALKGAGGGAGDTELLAAVHEMREQLNMQQAQLAAMLARMPATAAAPHPQQQVMPQRRPGGR